MKSPYSVSLEKVRELVNDNDNIGIIVKKNPGVDDMGGALSLYLSFVGSGKKASIVCPSPPLVEVSSLVGIDKVKSSFDAFKSGDLTVSFPYKEGEIEKISYTLEDGFLNILVKAGEEGLSFNEESIQFKRGESTEKVIFTIGITRVSEVNNIIDMDLLKDTKIVNIDNKTENQEYGDIVLVSKDYSSISEQVTFIILSLGLKLDIDIAQNLMSAIQSATDNFQSPETSALAFEMAAILMKRGATRKMSTTRRMPKEEDRDSSFFSKFAQKVKEEDKKEDEETAPSDWLAPKIYKGSTTV